MANLYINGTKKTVFTRLSELALEQRGAVELAGGDERRVAAEETPSFSTSQLSYQLINYLINLLIILSAYLSHYLPICLSRACLGKSSLFSKNGIAKTRFINFRTSRSRACACPTSLENAR
jgi:hypothetical protein